MDKESLDLLKNIIEKFLNNETEELYNLQIKFLSTVDYIEIIARMILLLKLGISLKTKPILLKKGQKLYRIRRKEDIKNVSDKKERTPNLKKTKNRFNDEGEEALYLSSCEHFCLIELHISKGEEYCLAEYEVQEDIKIGCFDNVKTKNDFYVLDFLNVFMMILNSQQENKQVLKQINLHFGEMNFDEVYKNPKFNFFAPFKLADIFKNDDIHFYTRMLSRNFKTPDYEGIRYSSSFMPFGSALFIISDYNFVLYKNGINKIKFITAETKVATQDYSIDTFVKSLLDS